uniref:CD8+ T cell target antigen Tp9 n=2 Tax=Theileria parva TaxID=5875 RepID=Q4N3U2_THEPA|eukprot:XP_765464.1 hypothetical protein [Theileria parva strain Muguga]
MDRDGTEPERGNPGIRLYAQGDPVFLTTLRVTPNESQILHNILKSHETSKTKDPSKGTGQSGIDLDKIRRNEKGIPLFVLTHQLTPEEAEILKRLLETQDKSGGGHDPSPAPSAPPEERPPPYAPGYGPPQGQSGLPGLSHLQGGYHGYGPYGQPGVTGGYGTAYPQPGPYQTPGATGPPAGGYVPPVQGYTGGAGGYTGHYVPGGHGTGHPPQGPYAPPAHGGYGQPAHGGYGQPAHGGYDQPVQGYTGGAGGYGGGYQPQQGPYQTPGATGPPTPGYGQQGATGYTPSEGQGPTDPGDDPSGPSDPSRSPKKDKAKKKLLTLQTKDTESSDHIEVLEYKIPQTGGKHRKHKARNGFGFEAVMHGNVEVWKMSGPCYAVEVTVMGVGKPKKRIDIQLSDGTRKRFGKRGKNKPWEPEVEKK